MESKKPKKPRGKNQPNPAFQLCMDDYYNWFKSEYPYPPSLNGRAGKSLNSILKKLSECYKIAKGELPTVDEVRKSFNLVLSQRPNWGFWKDKVFHLWQIDDKLIEILEEIKKHNAATNKSTSLADAAMDRFNSRQAI